MADWRESDTPKRKPKAAKENDDLPQLAPKPTGGWKGKKGAPPPPTKTARGSASSWKNDGNDIEPPTASSLRKWLIVGILGISAVLLTAFLIDFLFNSDPKLPLFVLAVDDYREDSPELLTNPYAAAQRKKLLEANVANISSHHILNNLGDDNALSLFNTNSWIKEFTEIKKDTVAPGGPEKHVVAFYIDAYATIDANDELFIHVQKSKPFASNLSTDSSTSGVKLENLLRNAVEKISGDGIAWFILDLQLPPTLTNLNDLDPHWETATLNALNKIDADLSKRLLITLPGKDGQQNWLAPEFSSSFFGYYVLQILDGRFTKTSLISNSLTIGQFQKLLEEKVSNRVNNRRFAAQNPVWLPATTFDQLSSTPLVAIEDKQPVVESTPIVPEHFDSIIASWQMITNGKYQRAYRWDPMGYAKVESQLLRLEDVAVTQPTAFSSAQALVRNAWDSLNKPQSSFGVSLIEDRELDQYLNGTAVDHDYTRIDQLAQQLTSKLSTSSEALPSFWKLPKSADAEEAKADAPPGGGAEKAAEDDLAPADRPFFVWQLFSEISEQENPALWKLVFTRDHLIKALSYAGESEPNWLETQQLSVLANDLDWDLSNADRPLACAQAIKTFNRLQKLATIPEPEVSWWIREKVETAEQRYLLGFDRLVANQSKDALAEFNNCATILSAFESRTYALANTMDATQNALHAIPHLLAWLSKEYKFAPGEEKQNIETRLNDLSKLVNLTDEVFTYLRSKTATDIDGIDEGLFTAGNEVKNGYDRILTAFNDYVDRKTDRLDTGAAKNSSQTYRRERICLLSPFLSIDARVKLHRNTRDFLEMPIDEVSTKLEDQKIAPERMAKEATDVFASTVKSERDRWKAITSSDVRLNWSGQFTDQELELPLVDDAFALRSELLKLEYWQRCLAAAFGASPSQHIQLATDSNSGTPWPWSCAWQRWNLSSANYRSFQVSRLSEASWGNGLYTSTSPSENFFFYKMTNQYKLPAKFELLVPTGRLADQFQAGMEKYRSESVARLKSLKVNFDDANQSVSSNNNVLIKLEVGKDWDAVAQVFLGNSPQKRLPWTRNEPDNRTWIVHISEIAERQARRLFETTYLEGSSRPLGNLAIRGNLLRNPIAWRKVQERNEVVELALEPPQPQAATIQVLSPKEKPPLTVVLLLDCSGSMELEFFDILEGKQNAEKVRLFDRVRSNVKRVMTRISQMHTKEADVRFAIIPFGLTAEQFGPVADSLLIVRDEEVYKPRELRKFDPTWLNEMEQLVDELKPSGATPLYDAIGLALGIANENPLQQSLIYVFSDGVNYLNSDRDSLTIDDVRKGLEKNPNCRLNIFHYDRFNEWLAEQKETDYWKNVQKTGISELESLRTLGEKQYGYYRSNETQKLMRDSFAAIPRSTVTITSINNASGATFKSELQPLDIPIPIDQSFLPAEFDVSVRGPFGNASSQVEARGGEQLKLMFQGGKTKLEFERFDTNGVIRVAASGPAKSNLYVKLLGDQLIASNQVGFALNFWNGSQTEFTRRPRFIVTEVAQSDDPRAETFILADHHFMAGTHYPEARQSKVIWPSAHPPAGLRVWASETVPDQVLMKSIEAGKTESFTLGKAEIRFGNNGSTVIAEVKYSARPQRKDRVVVICPEFEKTKRSFTYAEFSERHEFSLREKQLNQTIQLQFATIADLEEAVKTNKLAEFDLDRIELNN